MRLGTIVAEAGGVTSAGLVAADIAADMGLFLGVLLPRFDIDGSGRRQPPTASERVTYSSPPAAGPVGSGRGHFCAAAW